MRIRTHLLVLLALALVVILTGSAFANRMSLSGNTFRITSGEGMREGHIICPLTVEGSFHSRTFAKVAESLVGYITRASLNEGLCTGGTATYLRETLPWHLRYSSFTGTLPTITSMTTRIIGLGVNVTEAFGGRCLYRTTTERPGIGIWTREAGGRITRFGWGENERIRGTPCGTEFSLIGTANVTHLASTSAIILSLI